MKSLSVVSRVEILLESWRAFALQHSEALGWTTADVREPAPNAGIRRSSDTHSDKVLGEIIARSGLVHEAMTDSSIRSLNKTLKQPILLKYLHLEPTKKITELLGITQECLDARLSRARERIYMGYIGRMIEKCGSIADL